MSSASRSEWPMMTYAEITLELEEAGEKVNSSIEKLCEYLKAKGREDLINDVQMERESLREIADSVDPCRVGFYGSRGAGKTTIINRLLGYELLPTGNFTPQTASISEIHGWTSQRHRAVIQFITEEDWARAVNEVHAEVEECRLLGERIEELQIYSSFGQQLKCMYESCLDEAEHYRLLEAIDGNGKFGWENELQNPLMILPADIQRLINESYKVIEKESAEEFAPTLQEYTHRESRFWPIVVNISIHGPFQTLCDHHFILVDIPGSDDGDYTLDKRCREGKARCDRLYYVANEKTMLSSATAHECISFSSVTSEYGLILPRISQFMKQFKKEINFVNEVENFVRKKMEKFFAMRPNAQRKFQSTKIYPMENDDDLKSQPQYQLLFHNFIKNELASPRPNEMKILETYFVAVQAFARKMQTRLGMDLPTRHFLEFLQAQPFPFRGASPDFTKFVTEWKSKILDANIPPAYLFNSVFDQTVIAELHFKTLQHLLKHAGSSAKFDLAERLIDETIYSPDIDSLSARLFQEIQDVKKQWNSEIEQSCRHFPPIQLSLLDAIELGGTARGNDHTKVVYITAKVTLQDDLRRKLSQLEVRGKNCKDVMLSNIQDLLKREQDCIRNLLAIRVSEYFNTELDATCREIKCRVDATIEDLLTPFLKDDEGTTMSNLVNDLFKLSAPNFEQVERAKKPKLMIASVGPDVVTPVDSSGVFEPSTELIAFIVKHGKLLKMPALNIRWSSRAGRRGYVYIMTNTSHKTGIFKVGLANDVEKRRKSLFRTGVPHEFQPERKWETPNANAFEGLMKEILAENRINRRREFYNTVPLNVVFELGDLVKAFIEYQMQC